MTNLRLRPYHAGDSPKPASVPISVIVLTLNEAPNIRRCLRSVAWADQVLVVDSGSTDGTVSIAQSLGATIIRQPWLGFSQQREYALRLPELRHDWVYFVDADEWVSPQLAEEISSNLAAQSCAAYIHRLRLVFQGTWIRHCGWYRGSWVVRLVNRHYTRYDGNPVGERAQIEGSIGRLHNDIVDEDCKGLSAWLHKHVRYAQLEAQRRRAAPPLRHALRAWRSDLGRDTRPIVRAILKDIVYPRVPYKPLALFLYMYVIRLGFLDGHSGIRFCFYHAWYEVSVGALTQEASIARELRP
jgi:glycosyltransferase involved in cell wall biosynthesis